MFKKLCQDCGLSRLYHIQTWLDEIVERFVPDVPFLRGRRAILDFLLEKVLGAVGLVRSEKDFPLDKISMRSACFIEEARKRGVVFWATKGPFGYTNHFRAEVRGKKIRFESLPTADFVNKYGASFADSKERVKKKLQEGGFPVAEGKSFWFYGKKRAVQYGLEDLGFPLVVKPRSGSVARHVSIDINDREDLRRAIDHTLAYSPAFIVERFIADSFVHRATVIDFESVFCVKQMPAHVVGDGVSSIEELINRKNEEKIRGGVDEKGFLLHKLVVDRAAEKLLAKKNYSLSSMSQEGEAVILQKKPFLRLGGDLEEVTERVHTDNLELFKDIARFFDMRLVGIDFIVKDISRSWKDQHCAVLELNSMPCIELHHFPSFGMSQNVSALVVDLFFNYYL